MATLEKTETSCQVIYVVTEGTATYTYIVNKDLTFHVEYDAPWSLTDFANWQECCAAAEAGNTVV